jgi:hypothetical protein
VFISLAPVLRARLAPVPLDRALAAGADPARSAALTRRAALLSSRHARRRTAAGFRGVLSEPARRSGLSAVAASDRAAVDVARPALEQLERAIRERDSVHVQGLALAHLLLSDPDSVLYRAPHAGALYEASRAALLALLPAHEHVARPTLPVAYGSRSRSERSSGRQRPSIGTTSPPHTGHPSA